MADKIGMIKAEYLRGDLSLIDAIEALQDLGRSAREAETEVYSWEESKVTDQAREKPKEPFYYSNEHDQGMGVPSRCRCGQHLQLRPLGWTCESCGTGYGR